MSKPQQVHNIQEPATVVADLQEELAVLRAELEHSQRLSTLGILAAGIAHEINNILTPVLAYAQLASSHPQDRPLHEKAIEKAIQGVQTATQITQAMLGFAGNPDQSAIANVSETVKLALDCIGRDPAKDRITLAVTIDPDACVHMRPLALQQVLINLILNAIAVLRSRGGTIAISTTPTADSKTALRITDNGPGIPKEIAGRLFEPFVTHAKVAGRIHSSHAKSGGGGNGVGGTGLGLAICRQLIEQASGTITANSSADSGTTFTIVLPTARPARSKAV